MFVQKLKDLFVRLIMIAGSTIFSLLILEVTLRALNIPPDPIIPEYCKEINHDGGIVYRYSYIHAAYPPNSTHTICTSEFKITYHIDSNGYLGYADPDVKPQPLLVFGDSFAFGFGVEPTQSFAGLLGAYDAGLWGDSFPVHELAFAQIVDVVKPRQAIWVLYPPHIVSVSYRHWNTRAQFDENAHPVLAQVVGLYNQTKLGAVVLAATGWGINRPDYYTREWSLYDAQDTSLDDGYWAFEKAVKQVTRLARERNIVLIPVFIPAKTRLELEVDGIRPPLLHLGHTLDGDLPTRRMSEILSKYGIPVKNQIDVFDLFKDGSVDWHQYYFVVDGHLNVQGNKYVADFLKKKLETISNGP